MRVGILSQYYPPEMGAPQARLSELAARLTEGGTRSSSCLRYRTIPRAGSSRATAARSYVSGTEESR